MTRHVLGLVAALALLASGAGAQQRPPARFAIEAVGDTTFTFRVPSDPWVKAGMRGRAVDPANRDSLVAQFRVAGVDWGTATAVITGQTTAVTTAHVAMLVIPPAPWYRRESFWIGVVVGAGVGAGVVAATR